MLMGGIYDIQCSPCHGLFKVNWLRYSDGSFWVGSELELFFTSTVALNYMHCHGQEHEQANT